MKRQIPGMIVRVFLLFYILGTIAYAKEKDITILSPCQIVYQTEEWNGNSALRAVFIVPEEFQKMLSMTKKECKEQYGYDSFVGYVIFDWSIDGEDGWHYTNRWDQETVLRAPLYSHLTDGAVQEAEVFWLMYTGQQQLFEKYMTESEDGRTHQFAYKNHTLYVRAKFLLELKKEEGERRRISSDWSKGIRIVSGSKMTLKESEVPAPEVKSTQLEPGRGKESLFFRMDYPTELKEAMLKVVALYDSNFILEVQLRENGGGWKAAKVEDGIYPYLYGKRKIIRNKTDKTGEYGVQIRARYRFEANEERGWRGFVTPWSNIAGIGRNFWDKKEEKAQAVTAEAARREMREYNIGVISILMILFIIMLILIVKRPAEKKKKE